MDYRGYSKRIIDANELASSDSLGVLLGRYCISRDIPVSDITEYFGVSRMAIYNWFIGKSEPRKYHRDKIEMILRNGGWSV